MPILHELSRTVKQQRVDMGLTQDRLAELSGLSRATINDLETGKLTNLSLTRAERLANTLGFGLGVTGTRRPRTGSETGDGLELAALSGGVSYEDPIPPDTLRHALKTGVVPPNHIPQLRAFLDEAPLTALSSAAAYIAAEDGIKSRAIWQKMRQLAAALACVRPIWQ